MGNGTYACTCNDGFELTDEHSGVCKATSGVTELFYTSGEEIRAHEEGAANRETEIVKDQERIEGIDYDPKLNMIYWVDSQEKSIKRSFIPKMHAGVEIGHPQEIQPAGKGTAKLTDVSYDWVTGNLYWTEVTKGLSFQRDWKIRLALSLILSMGSCSGQIPAISQRLRLPGWTGQRDGQLFQKRLKGLKDSP